MFGQKTPGIQNVYQANFPLSKPQPSVAIHLIERLFLRDTFSSLGVSNNSSEHKH